MSAQSKNSEEKYLVPGLVRGIDILRLFSRERRLLSAPEMAAELGIPRSTVFRLVQTLEHLRLLEREPGSGDYRMGMGILGLGFEYLASLELPELARPVLERLSGRTGYHSHLVVRDGVEIIVVLRLAGTSTFASSLSVGTRLPAHGTVLGRVILADLDGPALAAVYGQGDLPSFSDQTPRTLADLQSLLAQDRSRGYAVSDGFFETGISAVAAPVRDASGGVIAGLNVTVPGAMAKGEDLRKTIAAVVDAAWEISGLLDHRSRRARAAAD